MAGGPRSVPKGLEVLPEPPKPRIALVGLFRMADSTVVESMEYPKE